MVFEVLPLFWSPLKAERWAKWQCRYYTDRDELSFGSEIPVGGPSHSVSQCDSVSLCHSAVACVPPRRARRPRPRESPKASHHATIEPHLGCDLRSPGASFRNGIHLARMPLPPACVCVPLARCNVLHGSPLCEAAARCPHSGCRQSSLY